MNSIELANLLGFLSLVSYIITLLPTTIKIVFPGKKKLINFLIIYRRQIGVVTFLLALGHAFLIVIQRNINFFDWKTYWIYIQGIITFIIFTFLAITSNNWSVKKLKKNWKRLHSLTYLAMFLLSWHVWDKMFGHWSFLTPLALLKLAIIIILFFIRKNLEFQKNHKTSTKKSSISKH